MDPTTAGVATRRGRPRPGHGSHTLDQRALLTPQVDRYSWIAGGEGETP